VAAIVGMAHGLGINLVAEGVENNYQAEYLENLGCHIMQGFLFSKPLKVEEFLERIAAQQAAIPNLSKA
jgi:EAL domain-containing protein (putative c-di-GMP-specific phosphodiesterase class I)